MRIFDGHIHGYRSPDRLAQSLYNNHVSDACVITRCWVITEQQAKQVIIPATDLGIRLRFGTEFYVNHGQPNQVSIIALGYRLDSLQLIDLAGNSLANQKGFTIRAGHQLNYLYRIGYELPQEPELANNIVKALRVQLPSPVDSHVEMIRTMFLSTTNRQLIIRELRRAQAEGMFNEPLFDVLAEWLDNPNTEPTNPVKMAVEKCLFRAYFAPKQEGYTALPRSWTLEEIIEAVHQANGYCLLSLERHEDQSKVEAYLPQLDGVCLITEREHFNVCRKTGKQLIHPELLRDKLVIVGSDYDDMERQPGIDLTQCPLSAKQSAKLIMGQSQY